MKVPSLTSMLLDNNGGRRKQRRTLSSSRLFQEDEDSAAASTLTRCTSYSTLDSTSPVVTSTSCTTPPSPVPLVLLPPPIDVTSSPADELDAVNVDIQKKNLNVSFGHVSVRRYFMILGDHPSCPTGVPISIGWEYEPLPIEPTVDEYESIRQSRRRTNIKQLSMNMYQRRGILNRSATTTTKESITDNSVEEVDQDIEKAIKVAMKQVKRIQKQRQITRLQSRIPFYNKLEEVLESTKRKISKTRA